MSTFCIKVPVNVVLTEAEDILECLARIQETEDALEHSPFSSEENGEPGSIKASDKRV